MRIQRFILGVTGVSGLMQTLCLRLSSPAKLPRAAEILPPHSPRRNGRSAKKKKIPHVRNGQYEPPAQNHFLHATGTILPAWAVFLPSRRRVYRAGWHAVCYSSVLIVLRGPCGKSPRTISARKRPDCSHPPDRPCFPARRKLWRFSNATSKNTTCRPLDAKTVLLQPALGVTAAGGEPGDRRASRPAVPGTIPALKATEGE